MALARASPRQGARFSPRAGGFCAGRSSNLALTGGEGSVFADVVFEGLDREIPIVAIEHLLFRQLFKHLAHRTATKAPTQSTLPELFRFGRPMTNIGDSIFYTRGLKPGTAIFHILPSKAISGAEMAEYLCSCRFFGQLRRPVEAETGALPSPKVALVKSPGGRSRPPSREASRCGRPPGNKEGGRRVRSVRVKG